jgi:hypothetical protein
MSSQRKSTELRKASMLKALRKSFGVVAPAVEAVGVSRSTHYEWMSADPHYQKAVEAITKDAPDVYVRARGNKPASLKPHAARIEKHGKAGYLYVIACHGFPYYKIGRTILPVEARFASIQTGSPFKLSLVSVMLVNNCFKLEAELHYLFAEKRVRGEWFELDNKDLATLKQKIGSAEYMQASLFDE